MSESRGRVLIVDDEEMLRVMSARMLEERGFEVEAVRSGKAAIESANLRRFDVVLTDLFMPDMDGIATLKALLSIDPDTQIIVMTGHGSLDTALTAMRDGAFDYIEKPVRPADLLHVVERALEKGALESAAALGAVSHALVTSLQDEELGRLLPLVLRRVLPADVVAFVLTLEGKDQFQVRARGEGAVPPDEFFIALAKRVLDAPGPLRLPTPGSNPDLPEEEEAKGFHSIIAYPLVGAEETKIGALCLLRRDTQRPFSHTEFHRGRFLASEVSVGLENAVLYRKLAEQVIELTTTRSQLLQQEKLAMAGQLAAGIAHEINTPIQFIGDSVHFIHSAFQDLLGLMEVYRQYLTGGGGEARGTASAGSEHGASHEEIRKAEERADLEYLRQEVPKAIERTLEGIGRVATIVRAMKDFAHPDLAEMTRADINMAVETTITVARNELKYVAEVETELGDLPLVLCHPGAVNQVLLNLLVNAAHAIKDVVGTSDQRGLIRVRTWQDGDAAVITVSDTGAGIPEAVRGRIFEPFFTTKEPGRGTGQGLAIARTVIVEKHRGALSFESEIGKGTRFTVRLPIDGASERTGVEGIQEKVAQ